jgi:hypothetical protein
MIQIARLTGTRGTKVIRHIHLSIVTIKTKVDQLTRKRVDRTTTLTNSKINKKVKSEFETQ